MPFYRRDHLKLIAKAKLDDALLLLAHRRWSNAYYLGGFAVEIGLKACVAKQMSAEVIPDKKFINDMHTHVLPSLIGLAGLSEEKRTKEASDADFAQNWGIAAQWSPEKRYEVVDPTSAQLLLAAVNDSASGVFPWIQTYW
ncbi:hypothetical protein [Hyphomicrobium sp.]|uniref:hypothetical protein n=1 Tax=Hyphomicrobium sp. TaxID=82 RepID=UPI000FC2E3A5|nr:hypothetical protein [Hyphomicrobium sp.]RUO98028.1 MAG: DNA-binding protein [Hyphomicrobium sp.]